MGEQEEITDIVVEPAGETLRERVRVDRGVLRTMGYDSRVAAIVVARVSEGVLLKDVLREYGMSWGTIRRWKRSRKEFREAMTDAEAMGAQHMVEEAIEIADENVGLPVDAMRNKLRTDVRWRLAEKNAPGKYGAKADEVVGLDWGKVLDDVRAQQLAREPVAPGPAVGTPVETTVEATVEATVEVDPI
jgi:hypothetical protein